MAEVPTPVLVFGDKVLSRKCITKAKSKFPDYEFYTLSMKEMTLDDLRYEVGSMTLFDEKRVLVIEDLVNSKKARDFLLDISKDHKETSNIILLDSFNHITPNDKGKFPKGWDDFLEEFKKIEGSYIINNGHEYSEKEKSDCIAYIQKCFKRFDKDIGLKEAKMMSKIVGKNKGVILSEVEKMVITAPEKITCEFIIENAFPIASDAIIYKLSNALDKGSYSETVILIEDFLDSGVHENVIADIMIRKARWQLAIAYYYSQNMNWEDIVSAIMDMGKFPSYIWYANGDKATKEKASEKYQKENMPTYLEDKLGIPYHYFKSESESKKVRPEIVPMKFMASKAVSFVRDKVVHQNKSSDMRYDVLERAKGVYLYIYSKLADLRLNSGSKNRTLYEMATVLTNFKI